MDSRRRASLRDRTMAAAMVCAVLAVLAPPLLTSGSGGPSSAAAIAVVFAFAALHHVGLRQVVPLPAIAGVARPADGAGPPLLRARATDPVHHPLRPRAPGQA